MKSKFWYYINMAGGAILILAGINSFFRAITGVDDRWWLGVIQITLGVFIATAKKKTAEGTL